MYNYIELLKLNLEAEKLASENKNEEAAKIYDEIISLRSQIDPNHTTLALLHFKKGVMLEKSQKKESAKESFEKALYLLQKSQSTRLYQEILQKLNSS
jgi:tetratricopeptide (TPR) repeat protein